MFRTLLTAGAVAGALVVSTPAAAYADGYLDEATQALQTSSLYVSPQVTDLSAEQQSELVSNIGSMDIAIVVLPSGAGTEIADIPAFIADVANRTGYETVLVSVGGDFEAGSSALPSGTASEIANSVESEGSLSDGLNGFVTEAQSAGLTQDQPAGTSDGIGGGIIFGGVIFLVAAGAVTWQTIRLLSRRKIRSSREVNSSTSRSLEQASKKRYASTPEVIRQLLADVEAKAEELNDSDVAKIVTGTSKHVLELFVRAPKTQIHQVTAQYEGVLGTMLKVLTQFADIETNPLYYEPTEREAREWLENGKTSAREYQSGVLKNIREIQKGALTDYKINTRIMNANAQFDESSLIQSDPLPVKKKDKR